MPHGTLPPFLRSPLLIPLVTATRSTHSPLPILLVRNANVAHAAHFAPAKPIAVFWMIRQNAIALQEKTMNGMKIQNDDSAQPLH